MLSGVSKSTLVTDEEVISPGPDFCPVFSASIAD